MELTPTSLQETAQAALRKRGQNFGDEDLAQLCRSWLAVTSEDARNGGVNPRSEFFWVAVQNDFAARFNGVVERTARSLETKWSLVQHSVSKFSGCYASVVETSATELPEADIIQNALDLYASSNKEKAPFKMLHCWKILRNEQKWIAYRDFKLPSKRDSDSTALMETLGRSPKKSNGVKHFTKLEAAAPVATTTSTLAKAAAKKAEAMEDAANLQLMTTSLHNLDPEAVEYIKLRRQMVLKVLRARAAEILGAEEGDGQ